MPNGTGAGIASLVEKPDLKDAQLMLASGNFLWNAGIFLFRAQDMIDAFRTYAAATLDLVSQAINKASTDLGFIRLASESWSEIQDISIDYAIMERAHNLVTVPYASKWSDLGGWDAVWSESESDLSGKVTSESAYAIECSNSLLRSESDSQQVVGIGLNNMIAIAMPDAVLVAPKERAQDVKKAVELLKSKDIAQAEIFPKDHRPWGWFESLILAECFQVKRIFVKLGAALSLQSHRYRSEHWVVVSGTANVTIKQRSSVINEGESIFVPRGAKHRLNNTCEKPLVLIEVQIGNYLGEDDIIRYDDIYQRY